MAAEREAQKDLTKTEKNVSHYGRTSVLQLSLSDLNCAKQILMPIQNQKQICLCYWIRVQKTDKRNMHMLLL